LRVDALHTLSSGCIDPHHSRCDACLSPSFSQPQGREDEDEGVDVLLIEVCEAMLADDKRGLLAASASLKYTLLGPFEDRDKKDVGEVTFDDFTRILRNLGAQLTFSELRTVAMRYRSQDATFETPSGAAKGAKGTAGTTLADRHVQGGMRAGAASDPEYSRWLQEQPTLGGLAGAPADLSEATPSHVEYGPLVERMARILDILLDRQGGIVVGPAGDRKRRKRLKGARPVADESEMSWMLREFELVDMLINQVHTTPVPHHTSSPAQHISPHVLILTDAAYLLDPCVLPNNPRACHLLASFLTCSWS